MAKQPRSHGLDQRLEALGYRLVRREPEKYATWNILPTRRKAYLGIRNLDAVQSTVERMEEELWLAFGQWLEEQRTKFEVLCASELGYAEYFLVAVKGLEQVGAQSILRRWYEPTE